MRPRFTVGAVILLATGAVVVGLRGTRYSPQAVRPDNAAGDATCLSCHGQNASYEESAHRLTSRLPTRAAILGSFRHGENVLRTANPSLYFHMDSTASGCYETAVIGRAPDTSARMERIAFVTGLRKGQSYLYWHADRLYQLPSYADGRPNFERPIPPRCLECHATAFESLPDPVLVNRYRPTGARLGISCETCHGAGREHVGRERSPLRAVLPPAIVNPARLPRERQLRRLRPLSQWDRPASNRAILVCAWAAPREAIHPLRGTGYDPTRRTR